MSRFLVAYDIAEPRRLRRVAKTVEREAVRLQKSVFLMKAAAADVHQLFDRLERIVHWRRDVVQAWELKDDQPNEGIVQGHATVPYPASVVHTPSTSSTVVLKGSLI